jgi:ABC-type Fe3+/spermidine/putrescine transport system ATPase subunit
VESAAVRLDGIRKDFGGVTALSGVTLDIERRQFVTLLGPSGCGKTTLLRIIAGLETPTAGEVYFGDERVTHRPPQARPLGFAFQRYALFPHLTVLENVAFGLKVRGVPTQKRRQRAQQMLELVHLPDLANRLPSQISGGQAQRVALARALAPEPSVLLLDEPLTALDLAVRTAMQEELRRLHRELGTTFVYVTHDQGEALTMSDRIILMRTGEVVQDSTPFELYRRPGSLFAATFVGEANVWSAQALDDAAGGATCRVAIAGLPSLEGVAGGHVRSGMAVNYVVRPQRIALIADAEEPGPCVLSARVTDVLPRGARALILASTGGPELRLELEVGQAEALERGSLLRVAWNAADAVLFAEQAAAEPGAADGGAEAEVRSVPEPA